LCHGASLAALAWPDALRLSLGLAADLSFRDRLNWDYLFRVMVATPGPGPILADAAFFMSGLVFGHLLMRVVAGPARHDPLAGAR